MQVDSAAPIPVPVQIRIPRLYRVEVLDTPANWYDGRHESTEFRSDHAVHHTPSVHASKASEAGR